MTFQNAYTRLKMDMWATEKNSIIMAYCVGRSKGHMNVWWFNTFVKHAKFVS